MRLRTTRSSFPVLFLFTASLSPCIAGIYPTAVEINLGAFPVDSYLTPNSGSLINGCSASITVKQCVQQLFSTGANNWRSQGVTGVRFFFTLAGGHYSTPFDAQGNVRSEWSGNLYQFFSDLHSYGIQKITPTPVFDTWSGPLMQARSVTTCNQQKTLNFVPWLPYGLDPSDSNFPDRTCNQRSYFDAAQTPSDIFWGLDRFFNLMDTVLAKAQAAGLGVSALDYYQESNMTFTVEARMIYDDYRTTDVLGALRDRMSWHGFDPGRVAPSANGPPTPTPASGDCASFYGDSALLLTLSELTAAIAGPWSVIGEPPYETQYGQLACLRSWDPYNMDDMISVPRWHSLPTFIDMHSQKNYPASSDTATFAKNLYSDIWSYMQYRGVTGSYVVFGETNPVDIPGCGEWTFEQADAMLNGVPGGNNGYKHSTLVANRAANVVMRPWHRTEACCSCTPSPNSINPPFDPFNP